jgi:hypothetical protein
MRNIGPFYVDECCLQNGFDELGQEIKKKAEKKVEQEIRVTAEARSEDLPENKPVIAEKPKRNYNRNGNVNIKKDE